MLSKTYTLWPADNFVEDVLGDFKFEVAPPYVLYRSKLDEVLPQCSLMSVLIPCDLYAMLVLSSGSQHCKASNCTALMQTAVSRTDTKLRL